MTIEDLIEELVGDIFSEDAAHAPEPISEEADGAARVLGNTPLREIDRALGTALPEDGDYTTVAGLVLDLRGSHPGARREGHPRRRHDAGDHRGLGAPRAPGARAAGTASRKRHLKGIAGARVKR